MLINAPINEKILSHKPQGGRFLCPLSTKWRAFLISELRSWISTWFAWNLIEDWYGLIVQDQQKDGTQRKRSIGWRASHWVVFLIEEPQFLKNLRHLTSCVEETVVMCGAAWSASRGRVSDFGSADSLDTRLARTDIQRWPTEALQSGWSTERGRAC